jgi:hypothetical protein
MPTSISNCLTTDNLPALFAPLDCMECNGSGKVTADDPGDPDARFTDCPQCTDGIVPYPGSFADQVRDFMSEVIGPIEQALSATAQQVTILYTPERAGGEWSFVFSGMAPTVGTYCKDTLELAFEETAEKLRTHKANAAERATLAADVEAFRAQRAAELGLL